MKNLKNYGSFHNVLMANSDPGTPEVGKRCTKALWTDRSVYDVIWVSDDKRVALIRGTVAVATEEGKRQGIGHQSWEIKSQYGWGADTIAFWRGGWRYRTEYEETNSKGKIQIKYRYGNKLAIMFNCESYYYDWSF